MFPCLPMRTCSTTAPCTFICLASMGLVGSTGRETTSEVPGDSRTRSAALLTGVPAPTELLVEARPGLPDSRSSFTGLLPERMVWCWSPATTSTSSGGSTARLTTGSVAGGVSTGLAASEILGALRAFDFALADVLADDLCDSALAPLLSGAASSADSCSVAAGNQKS